MHSASTPSPNPWFPRIALAGAALSGIGLIMWVAAQWAGWGPFTRFGLTQGVLALGLLGAAFTAGRRAYALLGWLAMGALFALIGQTYQTGADPWQLFALWTLLALPVALGARDDALWSGWALVAAVAVARWLATQTGGSGWDAPTPVAAVVGAALLGAVWLTVGPLAQRWTGAGRWAPRVAAVAALVVVTGMGLMALADALHTAWVPTWLVALLAVAALAAALLRAPSQDAGQLAATALAALVLGVGWLGVRLLEGAGSKPIMALVLLGVLAATLLASLVWALLRWQARSTDAPTWPAAVLTTLGAWLAAVPLLAGLGLALGTAFKTHFWLVGALLWAGAVVALRRPAPSRFVEQLMVPVLLAGGLALAIGVGMTLGEQTRYGAAAGLVAALAAAALLPQAWLRGVLGALALLAAWFMLDAWGAHRRGWEDSVLLLLAWLAAWRLHRHPHWRPVTLGWVAAWLGLVMFDSGPPLLAAGLTGHTGAGWFDGAPLHWGHGGSAALALAAAALLWRAQPATRGLRTLVVGAVLVALAAALPALGGVLLVLTLAWLHGPRGLTALAALAVLWLVGTLYYELRWPLAYKGLALGLGGALLVASVWRPRAAAPGPRGALPTALLLGALAVTLALANTTIWRQQQIVAQGRTVYVALVPVDPRSLMAGDYMQLAFALPPAVLADPEATRVRARVDAQGIATVTAALPPGAPPATGEVALPLRQLHRGRALVTDAYYFPEGQGARFAPARYGVLRVLPDGRALLTGLADARLQAL